jgi:uncharacterized protein (DUF433 family)
VTHTSAAATDVGAAYLHGMTELTRITRSPDVMGGEPCIAGTRVTVGAIVGLVASGNSTAEIVEAYPYLDEEAIHEALAYAACIASEIEVPPPS